MRITSRAAANRIILSCPKPPIRRNSRELYLPGIGVVTWDMLDARELFQESAIHINKREKPLRLQAFGLHGRQSYGRCVTTRVRQKANDSMNSIQGSHRELVRSWWEQESFHEREPRWWILTEVGGLNWRRYRPRLVGIIPRKLGTHSSATRSFMPISKSNRMRWQGTVSHPCREPFPSNHRTVIQTVQPEAPGRNVEQCTVQKRGATFTKSYGDRYTGLSL